MSRYYTYYYKFNDGYFCWTCGRMSRGDKAIEISKHGKIIIEKITHHC